MFRGAKERPLRGSAKKTTCSQPPRRVLLHDRQRRCSLVLAVVVIGLLVSACGSASGAGSDKSYASGDGVIEQLPAKSRPKLLPVTGRLLDGGRYDSKEDLGKTVVYNVWGSWCAPCRKEAPILRKVADETYGRGVRFVGINVRDNDASALAFERRYQIKYPSIKTADSEAALLAFGSKLPASAVPSTIIVDPEGRMAARIIGATSYGTLTSLVHDTLAQTR